MRRHAQTPLLLRVWIRALRGLAATLACCALGCGLEHGGLQASDASSTPAPTSVDDAAVSVVGNDGASTGTLSPDAATNPPDAATAPLPPVADADLPDVVLSDGASPGPGAGDPCDLDQDGYRATRAGCGGHDCCDYDGRAYPGEQSFFTSPDTCGSFDYDCNGTEEPEFAKASCTLGVLMCNGSGFHQPPPACGVVAPFDACNLGLGCFTTQSQRAQSCH